MSNPRTVAFSSCQVRARGFQFVQMSKRKQPESKTSPAYLFIVGCDVCRTTEAVLVKENDLHPDSVLLLSEYPWEKAKEDVCCPETLELLYHLGHKCVLDLETATRLLSKKFELHKFAQSLERKPIAEVTPLDATAVDALKVAHVQLKCDDKDMLLDEARCCLQEDQ